MNCHYTANSQPFCRVGSKRNLSGDNRRKYLTSMIDHRISPCELRKDAARRKMNNGMFSSINNLNT